MSRKRKKPKRRTASASPRRSAATSPPTVAQTLVAAGVDVKPPPTAPARPPAPPAASQRQEQEGALDAFVARVAPEVVGPTWMFDPPADRNVRAVQVRLTGQRVDVDGHPRASDRFTYEETWTGIVAGSGPVAVTTKVRDVTPGRWRVHGEASYTPGDSRARGMVRRTIPLHRARWSWRRWRVQPAAEEPVTTRLAPLVCPPAVLLGSWLALVITGIVVAVIVQSLVLAAQSVRVAHSLTVSLVSVVAGAVSAKAWYMVLHRRDGKRDGWAIQGFVAGFGVSAPLLLWLLSVSVARYLDATAPALLFGMAIGRVGCFFTGCCAGRPTASRWGVWSSNRTVGARRIPVQLLESLLAAAVGVIALVVVLSAGAQHATVFIAAVAAYTLIRQRLLLLREERRQSDRGTRVIAAAAAAVMVLAIAAGAATA